jgi:hypothetical protein
MVCPRSVSGLDTHRKLAAIPIASQIKTDRKTGNTRKTAEKLEKLLKN